jgi:AAHS family cis,cis-muconate transporter-like MFS transporter
MSQNEFQPQNNNSELAEYNKHWFPLFIAIFVALVVDGMDLQLLNLCLPVLKEDFAVTQIQIGALSSYTLLGMGIGGLMAGMLADRIGRVKVTIASLVMFSVFTACLAFTHSYWQFAVVRFFSGFGIAALYAIGTLLVAEYVPTDKRSTILGTLQAGWSIGYVCAALLSAAILPSYGWRPLFIITIIPALISFLILRKIKEPASFTASKKKQKNKENEYAKIFRNKSVRTVFRYGRLLTLLCNLATMGPILGFPAI